MLSGVAGVVIPKKVIEALELSAASSRGTAETRAGLGGTYAALGGWALAGVVLARFVRYREPERIRMAYA